ncbi:MAG: signal peptidase I [Eggerthellaceae bacterium]|nr:signal peptidase I [Eggerthellaceae bacterium]
MNSGRHAERQGGGFFRSLVEFILMLVVVLGAAWLLRTYVVAPYEIPSGSMEPTIMIGDKVFSEKVSYYTEGVQPGEIVTFADPEMPSRTLIKRCVAVGGQTIDLVDGVVYVDGEAQAEPYAQGLTYPLTSAVGVSVEYPYTVPEGYIWVMGDNRDNSADSRYFGAVPESSVSGHAFFVYWPLSRMGALF